MAQEEGKKRLIEYIFPLGEQLHIPNPHREDQVMLAIVSYYKGKAAIIEFVESGELIKLTVAIEKFEEG